MKPEIDAYCFLWRGFKRTLIHERRAYWFPGKENEYREDDIHGYEYSSFPIQSNTEQGRPKSGGWIETSNPRENWRHCMHIYLDELFWCPKCGTFSEGKWNPLPVGKARRLDYGRAIDYEALPAVIEANRQTPEWVVRDCGPNCLCEKLRYDLEGLLYDVVKISERCGWESKKLVQFKSTIETAEFLATQADQQHRDLIRDIRRKEWKTQTNQT